MIRKFQFLPNYHALDSRIMRALEWLTAYAKLSEEDGLKMIRRFPQLTSHSDARREECFLFLTRELGLDKEAVGVLARRFPGLLGLGVDSNLRPTLENLMGFGFTKRDVGVMVGRCPQILSLDFKGENMRLKIKIFDDMIDLPRDSLVFHPHYFTYSLKRLSRLVVLASVDACPNHLGTVMVMKDEVFVTRYEDQIRASWQQAGWTPPSISADDGGDHLDEGIQLVSQWSKYCVCMAADMSKQLGVTTSSTPPPLKA